MKLHHRIHAHLKQHHRKYLFGIFGSLAIVKTIILFWWLFGLMNIVNTFADSVNELNSGNITTTYNCSITSTECNLSNKSISSIAPDTFINYTNLKRLYLKENQLTSIEAWAFNGLSSLEYLFLDNNQISSIDSWAFGWLSGLKILSLVSNQLSSIHDWVFNGLSNLRYLDLNSNQLTTLRANEFSSLSSLGTLYVFSNQITSIEVGFLNGMPNLSSLNLMDNQISTPIVDGLFNGATHLKVLDLSWNRFSSISDNAFNWLSNLSQLMLHVNMISSIGAAAFNGLSSLNELQLEENQIGYINTGTFSSENWFSQLTTLMLDTNCSVNGTSDVPYGEGLTASIDSENCVIATDSNPSDFTTNLQGWSYSLTDGYYDGNKSISFSQSNSAEIPVPVSMTNTDPNTTEVVQVSYDSGTEISYNDAPFDGVLYSPTLYTPSTIPGMSETTTVMRFGDMAHGLTFNQPVTILMPAPGANIWDIVNIYSSNDASIYTSDNGPNLNFETTATVIGVNGSPYVEFPATHASRWIIGNVGTSTNNTTTPVEENTVPVTPAEEIATPPTTPVEATEQSEGVPQGGEITDPATHTLNGWGGSSRAKDTCPNGDFSLSPYDGTCGNLKVIQRISSGEIENNLINTGAYTQEYIDAYSFAFTNGMISAQTINDANMKGVLTRSAMAEMIGNFAINVLKKTVSTGAACVFSDISNLSKSTQNNIIQSCELWLMWYANDGVTVNSTFKPNQAVSRAQFGTILSRLLRGTKYNGWSPYYLNHLNALKDVWIMTKIATPSQKEIRGSALVMLQRTSGVK